METKLIEYAYPSSITATKNGYGKTGCYFVSLFKNDSSFSRVKILQYFLKKADAFNYAETLPNEYNHMHKYFNS